MKISDLMENFHTAPLRKDLTATMPLTMVIPALKNNDAYVQYRYLMALASAEAVKRGEVTMDQESAWNENMAVICYSPKEIETIDLANKMLGVVGKKISSTPSQEPSRINSSSPVRPFVDFDKD